MFHVQFLPSGSRGSFVLFSIRWLDFLVFFGLQFSNCFRVEFHFFRRPFIFVPSVCNHGASKLRLHVVARPASLAMSWPPEITWKVSRSGFDCLVLVLQSSNNFILNAFSISLQLSSSWLHGSCSVFAFGVLRFFCSVLHAMTGFFVFF